MLWLALGFLLLGVMLFVQARRTQQAAGLPLGEVIYADTSRWQPTEKPLYDPESRLTGRPDYLVRQGSTVIPVEVKSARVGALPHDSHVFQLAAYCHLVTVTFGERPPFGILHYQNRTFRVPYTAALESQLFALLETLRADERRRNVPRSHEQPPRCAKCGYRTVCDQSLVYPSRS